MATEVAKYLAYQLSVLPPDHPDRRFLAGLQETVEAFTTRDPATAARAPESELTETVSTDVPATPETSSEELSKPEQERVRLQGRLGYPPVYRVTPQAVLVGSFPLAVRDETMPNETIWWKVFVFRARAEKLREQKLSKGQVVEVIGYASDHTRTKRDGTTSVEHHVNAVAVKAR